MEKRFLLFAGDTYYPQGGWRDFIKSFDTYAEADNHLSSKEVGKGRYGHTFYEYTGPDGITYDWCDIHDLGEAE